MINQEKPIIKWANTWTTHKSPDKFNEENYTLISFLINDIPGKRETWNKLWLIFPPDKHTDVAKAPKLVTTTKILYIKQ